MVAFDHYDGPAFQMEDGSELRNSAGKLVVPILRVRHDFTVGGISCSRAQFPLTPAYAITVHKAQGMTLDRVVAQLAEREFASGLNYVACSRATTLQGLMFDEPFHRTAVFKEKQSVGRFYSLHFFSVLLIELHV